jgi:hypothetical protein
MEIAQDFANLRVDSSADIERTIEEVDFVGT